MDKAYEDYFENLSEGEEVLSFSEFTAALSGKPADCASSEMQWKNCALRGGELQGEKAQS